MCLWYWQGCYANRRFKEPYCWWGENLVTNPERVAMDWLHDHAAIHHIHRYYPEYVPSAADFVEAARDRGATSR